MKFFLTLTFLGLSSYISNESFNDYWYAGQAEISSYELRQARYGEWHDGHAVLVYVTEDFSRKKQVKLDRPERAGKDKQSVLKLNKTKSFVTGIYPYSMMTSVFFPIEKGANAVKLTNSSQEWCGQSFLQLNAEEDRYKLQQNSYFESEGDLEKEIEGKTEDGLWTQLRVNPNGIEQGTYGLIPDLMYCRLAHVPVKAYEAEVGLYPSRKAAGQMILRVFYPELKRSLEISFQKNFPYLIESWEEKYPSGFGEQAREMLTAATRIKTLKTDYWNKNTNKDESLRQHLGLE